MTENAAVQELSDARSCAKQILVIGGAGEMGAYACRVLVAADATGRVIVADRNFERAKAVAAGLGAKAEALALDVSDDQALASALADVDIVLNTAGPFYRFGVSVLRAAIASGTDYIDICDDWEPTVEMLKLDDEARAAGVTALIGVGSSPGVSNLLALLAMNQLETVEKVYTGWRIGNLPVIPEGEEPPVTAAAEHWIHNCVEPIKIFRGGRLIDAEALEEVPLTYPGIPAGSGWVCGHPEPLTLPKARPGITESLNLMSSRPGLMNILRGLADQVRAGEKTVHDVCKEILITPGVRGEAAGPKPKLPNLFAVAEGTKDGKPTRVGTQPVIIPLGGMGEMTGYPFAIGALMMARGEGGNPGVHGPEGALDPEVFFRDLSLLVENRPDGPVVEVLTEPIV